MRSRNSLKNGLRRTYTWTWQIHAGISIVVISFCLFNWSPTQRPVGLSDMPSVMLLTNGTLTPSSGVMTNWSRQGQLVVWGPHMTPFLNHCGLWVDYWYIFCSSHYKTDFNLLSGSVATFLSPSLMETFLQNGTYLVNDILKEDRKGKCRILQLI